MKRRSAGLLALALLINLLSGCGGKTVYDDDDSGTPLFPDNVVESAWESTQEDRQQDTQETQEQTTAAQDTQDEALQAQAREILKQIAYYGDLEACQMTAQQAHDYAQVIADGIVGNASTQGKYGGFPAGVVLWEEDNFVEGYTTYYTNRANVILGDFAADGVPYLYVYSSLVDSSSFEVYGYADGKAQQAFEQEAYLGREGAYLLEQEDGTVQVVDSGSMGAASHGGEDYSFSNGTATVTYQWEQTYDEDLGMWRYIENDVETLYTQEEVAAMAAAEPEYTPPVYNLPYDTLTEVEDNPSTLREMIAALNEYATLMSGGTIAPVEVQSLTDNQKMAWAMIQVVVDKVYCNDTSDIYYPKFYNKYTFARIIDLDRDGTMEMVFSSVRDEVYVYHWKNGSLEELDVKDPGGGFEEAIYLVQDQETGQYGVYTKGASGLTCDNYYFLDHREAADDDINGLFARVSFENGETTIEEYQSWLPEFTYNQQGISEAQYNSYLNQFNQRYLLGDTLYSGGGDYDYVDMEDVFNALAAIFRGETVSDQILGEFTQRETTAEPEFDDSYFADLIPKATQYVYDWYLDPAYVNTNDTVTGKLRGYDWPFYAVTTSGITTMEALSQQSHQYFTYSEISALEGDYVEQNGKLYLPRADGLGGESYTKIFVDSEKVSDTQYEVIVCGINYDGTTTRETVNYVLEDGQWVFDTVLLGAFGAEGYAIDQLS